MTSAIVVFVIAVVGLGIGRVAVGLLSDTLSASGWGEADGLRIALICAESVGLIGAIPFLIARPIYVREAKYQALQPLTLAPSPLSQGCHKACHKVSVTAPSTAAAAPV
jgi:hypothetical protein